MNLPSAIFWGLLMSGLPGFGGVVLNEIVSQNNLNGYLAADGRAYDWIELYNDGAEEVDLQGAYLTDDPANLTKWQFTRNFDLPADGYAVVFASDLDDLVEGQEHLNFKLDAGDGEYLALVASDGVTILDELSPGFPPLRTGRSFGNHSAENDPAVLLSATPNQANAEAAPMPVVNSFSVSNAVIANGESVTVSWDTENSDSITLADSSSQNSMVEESGSTILRPIYNQTITLILRNQFYEIRESLEVLVGPVVNEFSANPTTIATGGQSVLRWDTQGSDQVVELDGLPITGLVSPMRFTPSNLTLIDLDDSWKKAPSQIEEGWREIDFDDSHWPEVVTPFNGIANYRKTFEVDDPASIAAVSLRLSKHWSLQITLNGVVIDEGDLQKISPTLLREGKNVLTVWSKLENQDYFLKLGAWRSQPVDTIVPLLLKSSNPAGEESRTVDITVLAGGTQLPPLPTLAISEIFWAYAGTMPIEPYRFFEVQNCGDEALDLSKIQLIGSSYFSFDDANDPLLGADEVAVVVNHRPAFAESWPGDRNVIGQIENPQRPETYDFDLTAALLDPYGRVFDQISSEHLPEYGDFLQTFERANAKAPSNDSNNWYVNQTGGPGPGGGTPGELPFRIIDFSFDPPAASPGDVVTLNWEVSRPATLEITNGIGPVTGTSGSISLTVPQDARSFRYTLLTQTQFTAYQQLAQLIFPPSLISFTSSKTAIVPGEEVTIRWGQSVPYISYAATVSPEVAPGIYGGNHTFTPLVSGFDQGGAWRVRAHDSAPDPDWKSPEFVSHWRSRGGIIGFGDDRIDSPLRENHWLTAHYRRKFHVGEVGEINGLFLDLLNDDGIEIHLNGQEIYRDNLPEGELDHTIPALGKKAPVARTIEINPSYLVEGENTIAIAHHNSMVDDDDLVFDLGLRAQRPVPASGQKTYTITASNSAGSDSAEITILFREPTKLTDWQNEYGLAGDAATFDSDGDQLSDLLEFLTGGDPREKNPNPISFSHDEKGFLTVSYPHNIAAGDHTLEIQSSLDMQSWSKLSDFRFEGSVAPEGSDIAKVRHRSYSPVQELRFFRLIAR